MLTRMQLDLSGLEHATYSLSSALTVLKAPDADTRYTVEEREAMRAGVILWCQLSYDLGCSLMQRRLELDLDMEPGTHIPRIDLFRVAESNGVIASSAPWFDHFAARNRIARAHDRWQAEMVFADAATLHRDVEALLANLQARND